MKSRRVLGVIAVLALIVTGGCVGLQTGPDGPDADRDGDGEPDPDPEAVFEATFVHGDDLEDVSGEVVVEVTDAEGTITERLRVAERPYVDYRDEVIDSSAPGRVGDRYVSNATTTWWYWPEYGEAEYVEREEPFDSDAVRDDRAEQAQRYLEWYDLEYRGTEEVAGREAHVLDVEAREEAVERGISVLVGDTEYVYAVETVDAPEDMQIVEQTVWIDTEYEYPLKERLVYEGPDGERNEMVERFETVSFNEGLGDEAFAFEPPEDTVVYEVGEEYEDSAD